MTAQSACQSEEDSYCDDRMPSTPCRPAYACFSDSSLCEPGQVHCEWTSSLWDPDEPQPGAFAFNCRDTYDICSSGQ